MTRDKPAKQLSNTSELSVHKDISKLINKIQSIDNKNLFLHDPVIQFPAIADLYKKICPQRMWTNRMKSKKYTQFSDWLFDFELMIKNCLTFNANQPAYCQEAQRVYKEAITHIQPVQDQFGNTVPESEEHSKESTTTEVDSALLSKNIAEPASSSRKGEKTLVEFPQTLRNFLIDSESDMKSKFVTTLKKSDFPQFNRRYSVKMILCFFYVEAKSKQILKNDTRLSLESILRTFDQVADGMLFYESEREIFAEKLPQMVKDSGLMKWSEYVGIDMFLRFAFHFQAIESVAKRAPEERKMNIEVLNAVLKFVEHFFPQLSEGKNTANSSTSSPVQGN